MIKICIVAGARPNFMKVGPIIRELSRIKDVEILIVHTGQHYDNEMSGTFFEDLEIPEPDIFLGVGSGTHAKQTGKVMISFEKVLLETKPDLVVVVGDVNSTLACSLAAAKLGIKIAHVEAGLRSFDRSMPEEINRILTDAISDFLFITDPSAKENLIKEGILEEKIFFCGNVMIDTLLKYRRKAQQSKILSKLGIYDAQAAGQKQRITSSNTSSGGKKNIIDYALLTLHRPSNVDNKQTFIGIIEALREISEKIPIVFPTHPRTLKCIKKFGFESYFKFSKNQRQFRITNEQINCIGPLGYIDFLHLMSNSKLVLTDSGGIQEETTILGIPCVTIRDNTERPITITHGTNRVVGTTKDAIIKGSLDAIRDTTTKSVIPPLWDGNAAKRIVNTLLKSSEM